VGIAASFALGLLGCSDPVEPPLAARRQFQQFQGEVYPVLLRDCGFPACHGAPERFFRVWGPGRIRLAKDDGTLPEPFDVPTGDELAASYSLALSMIEERDIAQSPLVRKPLAVEAGGAGHLGVDNYGRDIYRTVQDSGYLAIKRWVLSPPPPAPMAP
jgi:hypothetical protein